MIAAVPLILNASPKKFLKLMIIVLIKINKFSETAKLRLFEDWAPILEIFFCFLRGCKIY